MLRCVYVDLELLREPDRLTLRALEACRRADVLVVPVTDRPLAEIDVEGFGDGVHGDGFLLDGEPHVGGIEAHGRARMLVPEECLRVEGEASLYEAVVTRLVAR